MRENKTALFKCQLKIVRRDKNKIINSKKFILVNRGQIIFALQDYFAFTAGRIF